MSADPKPCRIVVLAAMRQELRPLLRSLGLTESPADPGGLRFAEVGRVEVAACTTGIGTRAAERAAERVLDAGPVDHLMVVGIAGGIGPSVAVGDLVVPERVVDLASGTGFEPKALGGHCARGILATRNALLSDPAEAACLQRRGVIAIDMESAAIAAVCERRGCPWSVFRAISDRADDGSTDAAVLGLAGPDGAPDLPALARFLVTRPWRIAQLLGLARGLQAATRTAAAAAEAALRSL